MFDVLLGWLTLRRWGASLLVGCYLKELLEDVMIWPAEDSSEELLVRCEEEQTGFFLTGSRCTSVRKVTISYYFCGGAFARVKAGYLFHEEDHCLNCPTPWFRAADFLFGLFWQCQELLQLWLRCKDEMVEWLSRGAVFSHLILNIADNVGFGECTSHFPNVSNLPWWKVEAQPAEITEVSRCLPCAGGRALDVASLL